MQKERKEQSRKRLIVNICLIFIVSYVLSISVWMAIKDYYGMMVTRVACSIVTRVKGVTIQEMKREGDSALITFTGERYVGLRILNLETSVLVKTSSYTVNVPLTFAIMAAFYPYLRRKMVFQENRKVFWKSSKIYLVVLLILFVLHTFHTLSFLGLKLSSEMASHGFEEKNLARMSFWNLWFGFMQHIALRFEPFLIGFYAYIRFSFRPQN